MKLLKNTLIASLLLSLAFHAMVALTLWSAGQFSVKPKPQPLAVELMDAEQIAAMMKRAADPRGQIVEQDQRANDVTPENAKYLSKFNQKVVQETQAELNGKFRNTADAAGVRQPVKTVGREQKVVSKERQREKTEATEEQKTKEEKALMTDDNGVVASGKKPSLKDLTPSFRPEVPRVETETVASGGGEGPSATDDRLKNVRTGMQTMLSTREFVYYSYYNRIKDKLRQYWQPKIKEKVAHILRSGRTIASTGDKITKIIIVLDSRGILTKVQVLGPSGVTDLDDAAVEAFRAAAPFPNPPKGIIESDGTIKIRWDFILEA